MEEFVEIEVGDTKQPEFYPQFKVMKWNNECNFSIRLANHLDITDKEFYEIEEGKGFEFMVTLKEKPSSNVLKFTMEFKECEFWYQPMEPPEPSMHMPDNIKGSYAVYHPSKMHNEYKTGKIAHIRRPLIRDANNRQTWGVLKIDETKKLLTITIDQDFLDTAQYPIKVDPDVGLTTQGGTESTVNSDRAHGHTDDDTTRVAGANEEITSMTGWLNVDAGTETVGVAAYTATGGSEPYTPANRLAAHVNISISNTSAAEVSTAALTQALSNGTRYTMCWGEYSVQDDSISEWVDVGPADQRSRQTGDTLAATWSELQKRTGRFSYYYTYGSTAGGPDPDNSQMMAANF